MSRIADKHGLTNKYRPMGSKRLVKRGRPRKYLFGYSKPKSKRRKKVYHTTNVPVAEATPQQIRSGCLIMVLIAILFIAFIVAIAKGTDKSGTLIGYKELQQAGHPVLYDDYDAAKSYYREYANASVGSYQVHPEVDNPVVTALSYLDYDRIYLMTINLNNVDKNYTLSEALEIAVEYIPLEMVLENFDFEKAIYKTKADGTTQYECYYTQKEEGVEKAGYYYDGTEWVKLKSGLSVVLKETSAGGFIIELGDDWYAYVYDPKPLLGSGPSDEEMASHCDWDFRLEQYLNP